METYNNPVLARLPSHLKKYVVPQQYERYTAIDQAIWRYVMRQNYAYLKDVAYYPYIPGLRKAGLTIERIPSLQSMNDSLQHIGWGAATVDGFIPPSAFMEFQAYRVLVVAADIRQMEHIEYTPAPDIIHESSGHAPIIGELEYAEYLQYFGEIGAKAMFSAKDFELYEAIRRLSIIKEKGDATIDEVEEAESILNNIQQNMGEPSEMALLSRLHWWTVEYGLIGPLDEPKIYGAGLLSSIGESASCMRPEVLKLPYTLDAIEYPYDITKPQPQLFVTPDFGRLREVLDKYADSMAFRVGGKVSVDKAIACHNICTVTYSSGLQVSGVFQTTAQSDELIYIRTKGPSALSFQGKQLDGHDKSYHAEGFSSPVCRLAAAGKSLEYYTVDDLASASIQIGKETQLTFESGIEVRGLVQSMIFREDKLLLLSFSPCQVTDVRNCMVLFEPDWGTYDMAVGEYITSVFSGAADKSAFETQVAVSNVKSSQQQYDEDTLFLQGLYADIRSIREGHRAERTVQDLFEQLVDQYPTAWLALLEILEVVTEQSDNELSLVVERKLKAIQAQHPQLNKLIADGVRLVNDRDIGILLI